MNYQRSSEAECIIRDGIILVDKPRGLTSHDIVDFIRKECRFAKVGHAGTLDPMATGLLIILLGRFTKKSIHFSGYDKEYEAVLSLGVTTDTADAEGNILERKNPVFYKENIKKIKEIFEFFHGRIEQIPPMYSAKKINGKKLYEFARKGVTVKRAPSVVFVKEIRVLDVSTPHVSFYVKCSKGTYIRQLAHDIGERIGCGAHLTFLRRTKIGPFSVRDALPLERLKEALYENILQPE